MADSEKQATPPAYWIIGGVAVIVLGALLGMLSDNSDVAKLALILGGLVLFYGVAVKLIAAGVRASRDD